MTREPISSSFLLSFFLMCLQGKNTDQTWGDWGMGGVGERYLCGGSLGHQQI